MRALVHLSALLDACGAAFTEPPPLTVSGLLADGWEIAGYGSGYNIAPL